MPSTKKRNKHATLIKRKTKKNKGIKVIELKPKYSDEYMSSKEGEYFEKKDYDQIIDYDCDCYRVDESGKRHLLLKFRKNVIELTGNAGDRFFGVREEKFLPKKEYTFDLKRNEIIYFTDFPAFTETITIKCTS